MTQRTGSVSNGKDEPKEDQVIDFNKVREKRIEEKRRNTERIFLRDLLGVYSVAGQGKMFPVELIEVSEEGCSFQLPYDPKNPWPKDGKEMPLRLYFNREMYLEIYVQIKHSRHSIDKKQRYIRYGCSIDRTTQSYPAYQQFVRFLKLYSEHAYKDKGDVTVFYL
jgi:hypothetical protein